MAEKNKAEKQKPKLSGDELKEKLQAGEPLEGYYIERLNLSRMEMDKPVQLVECDIHHLDLNKTTFKEDVNFRRCNVKTFVGSDAIFEKKFDIKGIRISRGRIQRATFKGPVNGESSELSYTSFHKSVFEDKTTFGWAKFVGDATFTESKFAGDVKFTNGHFSSKGNFQKTEWGGVLDFKKVEAESDLDFRDSKFNGDTMFNGTVIRLTLDLAHSEITAGRMDFSNLSVGRSLLLNNLTLGEKMGFRFQNALAPSIILERDTVENHVFPEAEGEYAKAAKEYGFLRSAFEDINRFDDEDWAYYQFKKMERKGRSWSWNPIQLLMRGMNYLFLDIGCGYGTKPFRTLAVIGVMIVSFACVYFLSGLPTPAPDEAIFGFGSQTIERIAYSLHLSLIAFSSYGDLDIHGPMRLLAMVEYLMGVVFMGLFIVAFSRKVIR